MQRPRPQREPSIPPTGRDLVMWQRGFHDALITIMHTVPTLQHDARFRELRDAIERSRACGVRAWITRGGR